MARVKHPEWQASHQDNKYPFADNATLQNNDGMFIPETLFTDAAFYPIGAAEGLYLSRIVLTHDTATLYLGDSNTDEVASAEFAVLDPPANALFYDTYGRPAGIAVSEPTRLASLQAWTVGTHEFTEEQTPFAATCCIPTPQLGVRGILLDDGSVLTGDVYITGADGVILTKEQVSEKVPGCLGSSRTLDVIRVNIVGDPLFKRKECGTLFQEPRFVETISVEAGFCRVTCGPSSLGDFQIVGGDLETANPVLRIRRSADRNALLVEAAGTKVGGGST